ncbi:MAG: tetratricopeptide repeat protein [Planctomycetes bacterium]|nr:tetratricopeptide repeat protein [Planctomycetota bacterium]
MPINITCNGCGFAGAAPEKFAGKLVKCKSCGNVIEVPSAKTDTLGLSPSAGVDKIAVPAKSTLDLSPSASPQEIETPISGTLSLSPSARLAKIEGQTKESLVPTDGNTLDADVASGRLRRVRAEERRPSSKSPEAGGGTVPLATPSVLGTLGIEVASSADVSIGGKKTEATRLLAKDKSSGGFRYVVGKEIARGGMGAILLAVDKDTRREVAMKVILGDTKSEEQSHKLTRFIEEAQVTAQLTHPNIVPVYELGRNEKGQVYFTMKHVEGDSLSTIIEGIRDSDEGYCARYTTTRLLQIFRDVCNAIAFSHSKGVIHRDLKPDNIMVGAFGEVLVMDWGLAKVIGRKDPVAGKLVITDRSESASEVARTLDGSIAGTPSYMPPEQADGKVDEIDNRSDIYSLGAILCELLVHRPPVDGQNVWAIIARVSGGEIDLPGDLDDDPDVPAELREVCRKAMEFDPDDRYESALEIAEDIDAYLEGRTLRVVEYSTFERARKWIARNKATSGLIATAATALIVIGAIFWWNAYANEQQRLLELRDRFDVAVQLADGAQRNAGDIEKFIAERSAWDAGYKETPEEQTEREKVLAELLNMTSSLERALIAIDDPAVRERRARAGRWLVEVATLGGDYTLARSAAESLAGFGVNEADVSALQESIARREGALLEFRRERIEFALADLSQGLSREGREPGAPLLEDYVFEIVGYRDEQTVELLANALEPFAERVRSVPVRASEQTPDGATTNQWTQEDRDTMTFCFRVLGRLGLESAVDPLASIMALLEDPTLQVECGLALCNTRSGGAFNPLVALRFRLDSGSMVWRQLVHHFDKIPSPKFNDDLDDARLITNRGLIRKDQGDFAGAMEDFNRAIGLDPNLAAAYSNRASVKIDLGDLQGALDDYDRAIELNPRQFEFYVSRGSLLTNMGDYENAIKDLNVALEFNPRSTIALNNRGSVRNHLKDFQGAIDDYDTAIEIDERYTLSYIGRSNARQGLGDFDGALKDCDKLIELEPRSAEAYQNRGIIKNEMEDFDGAIADFSRSIELDPTVTAVYHNRGVSRQRLGDIDGAIEDYTRGIELDPDLTSNYVNRGSLKSDRGDFQGALDDYNRAIEIDPGEAYAFMNRANTLKMMGDLVGAFRDYNRAVELAPEDAAVYHNRSEFRMTTGDIIGALEDCNRAIELEPNRGLAYGTRGNIKAGLGDYAGAIDDYERFLELAPNHPFAAGIRHNITILRQLLPNLSPIQPNGELSDEDETLEDGRFVDWYEIEVENRDSIEIKLLANEFDAFLMLNRGNASLRSDDNSGGGTNAAIIYRASTRTAGTLRIGVTSKNPGETGEYQLIVMVNGEEIQPAPSAP